MISKEIREWIMTIAAVASAFTALHGACSANKSAGIAVKSQKEIQGIVSTNKVERAFDYVTKTGSQQSAVMLYNLSNEEVERLNELLKSKK